MNIAVAVVAFVVGCTQEFCDKYFQGLYDCALVEINGTH